jgi:flavin reductase (DIM6/NTAB) family NADH-FMN oxidoreductase RutF
MTATSPLGVTTAEFRRLMSAMPTSVSVLSLLGASRVAHGLTVNAVASVSLEPPILLVCVHRDARVRSHLQAGIPFVLNVLSSSQEHLARQFASNVADRFYGVAYEASAHGPLLSSAVSHIICRVRDITEVGDHSVIFADVTGGSALGGSPLVFSSGAYASMAAHSGDTRPNVGR